LLLSASSWQQSFTRSSSKRRAACISHGVRLFSPLGSTFCSCCSCGDFGEPSTSFPTCKNNFIDFIVGGWCLVVLSPQRQRKNCSIIFGAPLFCVLVGVAEATHLTHLQAVAAGGSKQRGQSLAVTVDDPKVQVGVLVNGADQVDNEILGTKSRRLFSGTLWRNRIATGRHPVSVSARFGCAVRILFEGLLSALPWKQIPMVKWPQHSKLCTMTSCDEEDSKNGTDCV